MITEKCNLIALVIYFDKSFDEEVAFLYNPTSHYYMSMPTKHFSESEEIDGTLFVTELKNAFSIPATDVDKKLSERRNRD